MTDNFTLSIGLLKGKAVLKKCNYCHSTTNARTFSGVTNQIITPVMYVEVVNV